MDPISESLQLSLLKIILDLLFQEFLLKREILKQIALLFGGYIKRFDVGLGLLPLVYRHLVELQCEVIQLDVVVLNRFVHLAGCSEVGLKLLEVVLRFGELGREGVDFGLLDLDDVLHQLNLHLIK